MILPGEIAIVAPVAAELRRALTERYGATEEHDPARVRAIVTSGSQGADGAVIDRLPALELICVFGVGLDRVDLGAAAARRIAVTTTPGVLTDDVADLAVALLHAAARRVPQNDVFARSGRWAAGERPSLGRRVTGRRVGIIGLGHIGRAVARRLEPIAGGIGYNNRQPVPDGRYEYYASAVALAAASDVLVIAASMQAGAPPIVDAAVLDALGPDGILVNVGRGGAVDETALVHALGDGRLLAAGLDVFADEPDVHPGLLASDRVVLQPHQGSATVEARAAMAERVLETIGAFAAGRPLPHRVQVGTVKGKASDA